MKTRWLLAFVWYFCIAQCSVIVGQELTQKQVQDLSRKATEMAVRQQQAEIKDAAQTPLNVLTTEDDAARKRDFERAWAKVAEFYPALKHHDSPLTERANAKQQEAVKNKDPFAWDPRSVQFFVSEAALELEISPSFTSAILASSLKVHEVTTKIADLERRLAATDSAYQQLYVDYTALVQRWNATATIASTTPQPVYRPIYTTRPRSDDDNVPLPIDPGPVIYRPGSGGYMYGDDGSMITVKPGIGGSIRIEKN
jgi:hypothetical protein